jgi:hypothetical protein
MSVAQIMKLVLSIHPMPGTVLSALHSFGIYFVDEDIKAKEIK